MTRKKVRDHKAEYRRRIQRGKARGLSRSQARGHSRADETPARTKPIKQSIEAEMESIRKAIASGESLTSAARRYEVSRERARRYIASHGIAKFKGGKWTITDERPRQVSIVSRGEQKVVIVSPAEASRAASYANAAKKFVNTNDAAALTPWRGQSVKDIRGRKHPLETDSNSLHRVAAKDEPPFHETYRIVV